MSKNIDQDQEWKISFENLCNDCSPYLIAVIFKCIDPDASKEDYMIMCESREYGEKGLWAIMDFEKEMRRGTSSITKVNWKRNSSLVCCYAQLRQSLLRESRSFADR